MYCLWIQQTYWPVTCARYCAKLVGDAKLSTKIILLSAYSPLMDTLTHNCCPWQSGFQSQKMIGKVRGMIYLFFK